MLQIWLLGQFDVRLDGKRVVIASRAAQSLLAFLALNPGTPQRREKLAGMLWPEMSDENARSNLRHELWRVRKALTSPQALESPRDRMPRTDYILAEELTIAFNADADYWLDVAQLSRAASADDSVADLITRLTLYRGELLPGFYDDWAVLERERVQSVFEGKMQHLLERLIAEERWPTVLEWAERWLALGQTPEAAYRALMIAHGAQGDMSKVALDYERCVERLREDLGVEPSADTRALYETLAGGGKAVSIASSMPPILIQPSGTVTFLFTDIEGSTKLLEQLGSDYASLLADHRDLLRETAEKCHGYEVDSQGDAFFFAFFRAADAVSFAAEAQRALITHRWPQDTTLRVRMGLHTGEPMLARTGYVGLDVHRAARIGAAGHGGQVLMSRTTRDLVEHDLPSGTRLDDLGEHQLKDLRYPVHIIQLTIEDLPSDFPPLKTLDTGSEPPAPGEAPFKGLQYFDENDADLFFGRELLTAKLVGRLRESRFLAVVVGASGSGKSSIVRAGVIPALRKGEPLADSTLPPADGPNWRIHVITPTAHPLVALATELTRDVESVTATATLMDDLAREPRSLALFLRRRLENRPAVIDHRDSSGAKRETRFAIGQSLLVIDQFEELFTLCHDELEREQFVDNLLTAISDDAGGLVTLVLTIRADFYAHLAQYPELRDAVSKHQEYIGPMTVEELRRAIEEPARRRAAADGRPWEFEPGVVDLMLRDVGDEPGALPLLSHALLETWKRRRGHTLTLRGYAEAGGVRGAITQTAETTYQSLTPEQQAIARNVFLRLTELGEGTEDTRRRASFSELIPRGQDGRQAQTVLTKLADARLITTSADSAEVAHEALIREWDRLREWLDQDREGLRLHRQLTEAAKEWDLLERDPGSLYRGARLGQAAEFAAANPNALNEGERAFLEASVENEKREEREREEGRQRELLAKEQLLEAEKRRVRQEQESNRRLQRRAVWLAGAFCVALLFAGLALFLNNVANQNARAAQENSLVAHRQERLAASRELAASAISNLPIDPELSILLSLQAASITRAMDGSVLPEAEQALHRSILSSHARLTLTGHTAAVYSAAFSPDGTRLATISKEGTTFVWDATTGAELLHLPGTSAPSEFASGQRLAFSPNGKLLARYNYNLVEIRDAATGNLLRTLTGHSEEVSAIAFSPNGKYIATGSLDATVRIWDATTGASLLVLTHHTESIEALAFSPDGTRLATASDDATLKMWDAATGELLLNLTDFASEVYGVAFSPDGQRLAVVANDLRVWELSSRRVVLTIPIPNGGVVAFTPDGAQLAAAVGSQVKLWDANTGQELLTLSGHTNGVSGITISPDGKRLATASLDLTAKVWDITPSQEVMTFSGQGARLAYSRDGTRLATEGPGGTINVWDAVTGEKLLTLAGHNDAITGVAFRPDGKRLATTSFSTATAKVWDLSNGQRVFDLVGHESGVRDIAYSPDGTRIATASFDQTAKVWDAATGHELLTLKGHKGLVLGVTFSPDGTRLATSSTDATWKLWDATTGELLLTATGHTDGIIDIAFSPDGTRLATASSDTTAKIWAAATGAELLTLKGHQGGLQSVSFSSDGTQIATGSEDNTAKVWDAATGKELHTVFGETGGVTAVAFSPMHGLAHLAIASGRVVRVYLLQVDDLIALAKTRVTRVLTTAECQKYLHVDQCLRDQ